MSEVEVAEDTAEVKHSGGSASLYNKYRPHCFSDIIGQDLAKQGLKKAIADKTLKHAYLLAGDRGCGKTTTARIIAAAANCEFAENGEPCTTCDNCVATFTGTFTGVVQEINAADNRGIDDIRQLLSTVDLGVPHNKKFIIIDEVHRLTPDAASLLLKPIEEPVNDQIVFILATTDPQKMLSTILSRVTRINFTLLSDENLFGLVEKVSAAEGFDLTEDQKRNIVYGGHGSARDTLSELERVARGFGNNNGMKVSSEVIEAITKGNLGEILRVMHVNKEEMDYVGLLEDVLEFHELCIFYNEAPDLLSDHSKWIDFVKVYGAAKNQALFARNIEILAESLGRVQAFGSRRIMVEGTLARLISPTGSKKVDAMSDDINSLKKMIGDMARQIKAQSSLIQSLSGGSPVQQASGPFDEPVSKENSTWPGVDDSEEPKEESRGRRSRRGRRSESSSDDSASESAVAETAPVEDAPEEEGTRRRRRRRSSEPEAETPPEETSEGSTRRRRRGSDDSAEDQPESGEGRRRRRGSSEQSESTDQSSESMSNADVERAWTKIIADIEGDRNSELLSSSRIEMDGTVVRVLCERRTPGPLQRQLQALMSKEGIAHEIRFSRI